MRRIISLPVIISATLAIIIVIPLFNLIYNSFTSLRFGVSTGFTLVNYMTAYSDPDFGPLLLNSIIFAGGSAALATILGTILAWIVTRTDTPLKTILELVPIVPLLFPPMLKNIGWIHILAPRSGILNNFLRETFGIQAYLFNAFSMPAMIWAYGLAIVPTAYLLIVPGFLLGDPALEEAAFLSGAGTVRTTLKITLPLALPSILSSSLLLFISGLGAFETPVLQGMPGGIWVFMSKIFDAVTVKLKPGLATAYATTLVLATTSLVAVYIWYTRRAEKFATIIGKGYRPRIIRLGRWRYITLLFAISYFIVAFIAPYAVVAVVSFIPYFNYNVFKNFASFFTWSNYERVLNHPIFVSGLINSFQLGLAAAALTIPLAAITAHVVHRRGGGVRKVFEFTGTLPIGIPGMLLALGLLWSYFGTPLYGSLWGILVAFIIVYTPFCLRAFSSAMVRIHKELEEAANIHGSSWFYTFTRITLQLLRPALASAFFYMFIQIHRRLGVIVLLTGPGTTVASMVMFDYFRVGEWGHTSAAGIILGILLFAYVLVAKLVFKVKFRL